MNRRAVFVSGLSATFLAFLSSSKKLEAQQSQKVAWIDKSGVILLSEKDGSVPELQIPPNSNIIQVSGSDLKFSYPVENRGLQDIPLRRID
jgi:hypothetical protein